jgi:hypothetical protein
MAAVIFFTFLPPTPDGAARLFILISLPRVDLFKG